jgi:hypothetical protein
MAIRNIRKFIDTAMQGQDYNVTVSQLSRHMGHGDNVDLAFYRQHPMAIEHEVPNRSYQASIETAGDITGEPVLSATGTEKGEYRVVQGNPIKAPRSKQSRAIR